MCDHDPRREPSSLQPPPAWEYLFDAVMLTGVLLLIWYALHVVGWLPPPPEQLFKRWNSELMDDKAMTVYVLAVVGISEFASMYLVFNDKLRAKRGEPPLTAGKRQLIRCAYAASVWLYMLVLYFIV